MSRLISYPVAGGTRKELSRDRVARAALARIDRDGIDELSMRKLGADLGVEAMSLYHYVENKDDLLDAVMVLLYNEIEIPVAGGPTEWRSDVRLAMRSFYQVLRSHPASLTLFSTRPANIPEAFTTLHDGFSLLRAAGLDATDAYGGLNFAVSYVMGHASEAFRGSAPASLRCWSARAAERPFVSGLCWCRAGLHGR